MEWELLATSSPRPVPGLNLQGAIDPQGHHKELFPLSVPPFRVGKQPTAQLSAGMAMVEDDHT